MQMKNTVIDVKKTGERIRFFMEKEGKSKKDVAEELGVTINAVNNYLNGYNLPDTERLYKLCKYLNVNIQDIIVEKEE